MKGPWKITGTKGGKGGTSLENANTESQEGEGGKPRSEIKDFNASVASHPK